MDINKAQNLLYKINNLFQSINMTQNQVSSLERDLMKNYILEFYEVFTEISPLEQNAPEHSQTNNEIESEADSFDQNLDVSIEATKQEIQEMSQAIPVRESIKTEIKEPDQEHQIQIDPVASESRDLLKTQETVEQKIEIPQEQPVSRDKQELNTYPTPQSAVFNLDPKLEALFEVPKVQDLSDKLSSAPIQDLGRAFGVNERILTINELFGGDIQLFNNTIQSINGMDRFEDAKKYLVLNVAKKNQWVDEHKKFKASSFIKTVRRKFQS